MARILAVLAFALLVTTACSDDKNPVREYGNTLTGAMKKTEHAKTVADLTTIRAELMRYKAERGEYPPSLQALNLPTIHPDQYSYDPATGAVDLAK